MITAARRPAPLFALALATGLILFVAELTWGSVRVPLSALLALPFSGEIDQTFQQIVFELRLPRATAATLAGAGLAVSGLLLQTVFRNPLAGPWALGVTAGAQVGVALVVVTTGTLTVGFLEGLRWASRLSLVAGAFAASALVLALMIALSRTVRPVSLLILGLMGGFMAQGVVNILLHFTNETQAKVYQSWDAGGYGGVGWEQLYVLLPLVLAGLVLSISQAKPLNALLLGETYAGSVGVRVAFARRGVLATVVGLAGTITAYCGPITFIDLIVPHICRALFRTPDHGILLPAVAIVGGSLGLAGDLIANGPWERHFLHVNAVNAIVGGPVIAWLILKHRHTQID
jgi:iron complex transport system permease protein